MNRIFLDTSILIRLFLHDDAQQEQIRAHLRGQSPCTSAYVFMEFQRAVLQVLAYVRAVVLEWKRQGHREIFIHQLLLYFGTASGRYHSLRLSQVLFLGARQLGREFGLMAPASAIAYYLEQQITIMRTLILSGRLGEVLKDVDCDLIGPDVPLPDLVRSRLSCNAATAQCQLAGFLGRHRDELHRIQEAMLAAPPQFVDAQTRAALHRITADPTAALGERTCWPLGDIIIALTMPSEAFLYTTGRHFEVICKAGQAVVSSLGMSRPTG